MNLPPVCHATPAQLVNFYSQEAHNLGYHIALVRKLPTWKWEALAEKIFTILIEELVFASDSLLPEATRLGVRNLLATRKTV